MATTIRILDNTTSYYFSYGHAAKYTGSGTPWTAANTTPFELANNPVTGEAYRPVVRSAPGVLVASPNAGGAPLMPLDDEPEPIAEVIPFQVRASSVVNAMTALQTLKRVLLGTFGDRRKLLQITVDGGSVAVTWELLAAFVQELPISVLGAETIGTRSEYLARAELHVVRRAYGGVLAGSESLVINAASITNSAASCTTSMAMTAGDLQNAGQPANIRITPSATQARFYIASILNRSYDNTGFSATSVSGGWTTVGTATLDVSALWADPFVTPRLFVRGSTASATFPMRVNLILNNVGTIATQGTTSAYPYSLTTSSRIVDIGDVPLPVIPEAAASATLYVQVQCYNTGAASNATVDSVEVIFYREFCVIDASVTSSRSLRIISFPTLSSRACLPFSAPIAGVFDTNEYVHAVAIRGVAPRLYATGSLWVNMATSASTDAINTAHTATVTAYGAPLYTTVSP